LVERYYRRRLPESGPNPFQCQGFVRNGTIANADGEPLPIASLPPFLRALLVTDGTVTKALEAYFWEPVIVDTLRQEFITAADEIPWIEVSPGDQVLVREALLRGGDSGKQYARAFSVIRTTLIPASFRQRLVNREIGIGVLIRDSGLESFREVMEVGVEPESRAGTGALSRTYRIIIDGKPVILISEMFPLELYL
jgi:chorismate-pyruvate lyase